MWEKVEGNVSSGSDGGVIGVGGGSSIDDGVFCGVIGQDGRLGVVGGVIGPGRLDFFDGGFGEEGSFLVVVDLVEAWIWALLDVDPRPALEALSLFRTDPGCRF